MTDFILPTITTRKRRLVSPENRKKAMFSCDHCKKKKSACRRNSNDFKSLDPCTKCVQLGIDCKTTMKRKKRPQTGPLENVDLHYRCLYFLVKGMFPDVDTASIDSLIQLGESLDILMPSSDGHFIDQVTDEPSESILLGLNQPDKIIVDQGGNHHYIGPFGAPSLLDTTINVISNNLDTEIKTNAVQLLRPGMVISSQNDKIDYGSVDFNLFPLIRFSNKKELDHYIDTFFRYIHPSYYCLNEHDFREVFNSFWWLSLTMSKNYLLSNAQICLIYMVLVVGREYEPSYPSLDFDVPQILNTIKLCLPSMVLSPSLDSLRCLLFLSIHMDNNRRRETGYFLTGLVARQAIGMGLNKKSILSGQISGPSTLKQPFSYSPKMAEEIKLTWWAIFKYEIAFSLRMGRPTIFKTEDINIGYPTFELEAVDPELETYVLESIKLSKLVYEIVECRKLIKNGAPFSHITVLTTFKILKSAKDWYFDISDAMDPSVRYCTQLKMLYHYYIISATLPYLLYVTENISKVPVPAKFRLLVQQCLDSSTQIVELFQTLSDSGLINGSVSSDIFVVYHAAMGLATGYTLLQHDTTIDASPFSVQEYLVQLRDILSENESKITGSSEKLVQIVNILVHSVTSSKEPSKITISDLDMKFHGEMTDQPVFDLDDSAYIMNITDVLDFDM